MILFVDLVVDRGDAIEVVIVNATMIVVVELCHRLNANTLPVSIIYSMMKLTFE